MKIIQNLREKWNRVLSELSGSDCRRYISPSIYAQYDLGIKIMREYARGRMIDLGCGDMPYKPFLVDLVNSYDSLDLRPVSEDIKYIGDIQNMHMIDSSTYDFAICMEVLEHVPQPQRAINEIYRILRPGGILVLSVPHLSHIHNPPNDYFRFTSFGLLYLLDQAGFKVINIQSKGGIFSFLGHYIAILLLSTSWNLKLVRKLALLIVKHILTPLCYKLDKVIDIRDSLPLGYIVVAQKLGK